MTPENAEGTREAVVQKPDGFSLILVVLDRAKMGVADIDRRIRRHRAFDPKVPRYAPRQEK